VLKASMVEAESNEYYSSTQIKVDSLESRNQNTRERCITPSQAYRNQQRGIVQKDLLNRIEEYKRNHKLKKMDLNKICRLNETLN